MVFEFARILRKYPIGKPVRLKGYCDAEVVHVTGYQFSDGAWYIDADGRTFLLSRLEALELKESKPITISGIVQNLKEEICIRYCRYYGCYEDEEELLDQKCHGCPLYQVSKNI